MVSEEHMFADAGERLVDIFETVGRIFHVRAIKAEKQVEAILGIEGHGLGPAALKPEKTGRSSLRSRDLLMQEEAAGRAALAAAIEEEVRMQGQRAVFLDMEAVGNL